MIDRKVYEHIALTQLRAEIICAEVINKGISFDNIVISYAGSFRKSYRNDISGVITFLNDDEKLNFEIEANRDSLYDRLPEGLFHQTRGNSNTSNLSEIIGEHRRYREEEKYARKFFKPFEQEFFKFSMLIELWEQKFAFTMLNGDLKNELSNFWNIPKELPSSIIAVFLRIMPWVHTIKGDLDHTAQALSVILQKPVSAIQKYTTKQQAASIIQGIGEVALGINSLTGNAVEDTSIEWVFTIHELSKKEVALYPDNSIYGRLLKEFEEIFIPLSIDVIFDYDILEQTEEEHENVLGFSLIL